MKSIQFLYSPPKIAIFCHHPLRPGGGIIRVRLGISQGVGYYLGWGIIRGVGYYSRGGLRWLQPSQKIQKEIHPNISIA